ncbi:MAG: N-acetylgalactosamine-6-sulfatase [Limisphaerales bacterium]|nr:MAG: N-acetylgalactosamine-6-sulfatase [Limisphaerales bacterium]KAG0509306.1 MAG: N-acetylgalactosamine-6-sulfatase [Limisphaerales bacterium]TXT45489.1 MAG: N-acetylgalactosamine-6-sulfatase [Limisphaerales bacterium]
MSSLIQLHRGLRLALLLAVFALNTEHWILNTAAAVRRPNVIFFLVDDMGWMDCGAYGSKYYPTPNMDRFATRALRFTDAYAQPLCSPTRASLLTGKYSARHGITSATGHQPPQPAGHKFLPGSAPANRPLLAPESKNYLEPSELTLAEALRAAGYRTAHIGKWHLGLTPPHWPEQQGFDVAFHCHPDPGPPGNYFSPYGVKSDGEPRGQQRVGTITDGPPGEYIVDRVTDEAVKFIEANRERPFFLNLWQYGVHGPWGHKEAYTRELAKLKDPRGKQGNPIMASMLRSVDESFGRVLDTLDRLKLAENTIVIFNSDNGGNVHSNVPDTAKTAKAEKNKSAQLTDWRKWAGDLPPTSNDPLRDGKGTLYEGGTRVPLMWAWAGRIQPGLAHDVVGHIDLYPTVLDLIGVPRPAQQKFDGVSYARVLRGEGRLDRAAFFNYFPHARNGGGVWVRAGDWKLIRWFDPGTPRELFNLKADLGETNNLAAAQPAKVKELDALMDGFLKDTGATYPRPNPAYKAVANPAAAAASAPKAAAALGGWVPKFSTTEIKDGALVVTADGRTPFLGLTGLKHAGPVTLSLRAKSAGGLAKVQWRTADQETFPASGQVSEFALPGSADWAEAKVTLPVTGSLLHLRLYLPAQASPVTLDWVELKPATGKPQRWDF